MSKKYGQLLTKHGKIIGKHGKQLNDIGEYLKDENNSDEKKLDLVNKRINLLLAKTKRDQRDYISKVNKMDNDEVHTTMHMNISKAYEIMVDLFEEIKEIDYENLEDYINAIEKGDRRINWFFN